MREVVERVTCSIDGTQWITDGTASDEGSQVVLSLSFSGETSEVMLDVCAKCRPTLAEKSLAELMRAGDAQKAAVKRRAKVAAKSKRPRRGKEQTSAERWASQQLPDGGWLCPDVDCKQIKETAPALGRHIGAAHPDIAKAA